MLFADWTSAINLCGPCSVCFARRKSVRNRCLNLKHPKQSVQSVQYYEHSSDDLPRKVTLNTCKWAWLVTEPAKSQIGEMKIRPRQRRKAKFDGLYENVRIKSAMASLLEHEADIMKSIVAAVTEAVLSQLTGNSDFVNNIKEASKCGPILDRVKQEVYKSVSIDIAQTTAQTTDVARGLEKRVTHLERENAWLHDENNAQEQYSRRNCPLLHGVAYPKPRSTPTTQSCRSPMRNSAST